MDISKIINAIPVATVAAAAGGLATKYLLPPIMQMLSGSADISNNVGSIKAQTESYVSMLHLDLSSPPMENIRSVFIVDGKNASITYKDGDKVQHASVRLDHESGRWLLLQAKRNVDKPAEILSLFQTQVLPEQLHAQGMAEIRGERESWMQPISPLKRLAGLFTATVSDDAAAKIREPLFMLKKVLEISPQADIDLGGTCHAALKITDPVTKLADIIVMPTMKCEAERIAEVDSGEYVLPDRKLTPIAVRNAILEMHAARAGANRTLLTPPLQ